MTLTATTRTGSKVFDDVVRAAWWALAPAQSRANVPSQPRTGPGCARCAHPEVSTAVKECVSKSFGSYDGWVRPDGMALCAACAWCYTTPDLRSRLLLVADDGTARQVTRARARSVLLEGLGGHRSLVLPLRGRKHLLAAAGWGQVVTESGTLMWSAGESVLLADVVAAREAGASTRDLAMATPSWALLAEQPGWRVPWLLELWARLEPMRRSALRLHLLSVVTSPDKLAPARPVALS